MAARPPLSSPHHSPPPQGRPPFSFSFFPLPVYFDVTSSVNVVGAARLRLYYVTEWKIRTPYSVVYELLPILHTFSDCSVFNRQCA